MQLVEFLAPRLFMDASAVLTARGTLLVIGTDTADRIVVTRNGGSVVVHFGPSIQSFDQADVKRVRVDAASGADRVVIRLGLRSSVNGGGGDDWLETGINVDSIVGGSGDDTLWGHGGGDTIEGDRGVDALSYQWADDGIRWTGNQRQNSGDILP